LYGLNAGLLAVPLPLARVALAGEAGDQCTDPPTYDPIEQRVRKTPAASAADVSVNHGKMLRRRGDPFDDVVDFRNEAIGQLASRVLYQSRASISSAGAAGLKTTDGTSAPLSELGSKLVPRDALFSVLIETSDPPVEFGSLGIGHRYVLVVEALPEGLDQIEPLARREPSQLRC
jgi:hypothetical protein